MKRYIKLVVCVLVALLAFESTSAQKSEKAPTTLRFMDWNIADGMWWDQFKDYFLYSYPLSLTHIHLLSPCYDFSLSPPVTSSGVIYDINIQTFLPPYPESISNVCVQN